MSLRAVLHPPRAWLFGRESILGRARARWQQLAGIWRLFSRQPLGLLGLGLIVLFGIMAMAHPILMATVWDRTRYHPVVGFDIDQVPHPNLPSPEHILGTDSLGRDVLSQLLFGARTSFGVGLAAALVSIIVSLLLGGSAGYFGGLLDVILMGVSDVFVLLPAAVALLIVGSLVDMQWPLLGFVYGTLAGLGGQALVIKSHTLTLKVRPFVEAARVAGGSEIHILRTHIVPGLLPVAFVQGVFTVVGAVLIEALLSFFGRTQIRLSWGTMIWFGQRMFRLGSAEGQWHAILPPAFAIMLFCGGFYLVGRALDEVLNPRLRKR